MTSQGLEDAIENFLAQLQCAICLCTYDSPYSLPCNHCFCEQCIHRALELKPNCPICKAPTRKRNLRPDPTINKLLSAVDLFNTNTPNYKKSPAFHGIKSTNNFPTQLNLIGSSSSSSSCTTITTTTTSNRNTYTRDDATDTPSAILPRRNNKKRSTPTSSASTVELFTQKIPSTSDRSGSSGSKTSTPKSNEATKKSKDSEDEKQEEVKEEEEVFCPASTLIGRKRKRIHTPTTPPAPPHKNSSSTPITTTTTSTTTSNSITPMITSSSGSREIVQKFLKGQLVEVMSRTWTGINKPGGFAWITHVNEDGTLNVKYILDNRKENRVSSEYFKYVPDEIISDTTPGRSVKNRQRKHVISVSSSWEKSALLSTNAATAFVSSSSSKHHIQSGLVFLCSGFSARTMTFITKWAESLHAKVISEWSSHVTHLIVRCVSADTNQTNHPHKRELFPSSTSTSTSTSTSIHTSTGTSTSTHTTGNRWVKIRSLKYLKALVAGRWIVSETWLQACAKQKKHVCELDYEADGHLKGQQIHTDAVRISRKKREKWLQLFRSSSSSASSSSSSFFSSSLSSSSSMMTIGTRLFKNFFFFLAGEFLPPMPPSKEILTLLSLGEGHVIQGGGIHGEEEEHILKKKDKVLVIVCDKMNDRGLEEMAERFLGNSQSIGPLARVKRKAIVSYQWVLDSISEAQLLPFKYSHDMMTNGTIDIFEEEARQDAKEEEARIYSRQMK